MKKRLLAIGLSLAMTAGILAGCGSGSGTASTAGSTAASKDTSAASTASTDSTASTASTASNQAGGKTEMTVSGDNVTTLNVWTFIELHQQFYTDMAEKWNEQNPDKKVKLVLSNMQYDDMHNKLALALQSGEGAPDIADIELGKFPSFTSGKEIKLRDLTDVIEPYKQNVVASRLNIYSKDGKYYGLPTHVGTEVAFYNTEELQKAGIDYTTIKTWDDFKAAGVKYHDATGKEFATAETTAMWMVNLMLAQKGGDYLKEDGTLDVNNDKVVEVLQYIKDMQDAGALGVVPGGQPDNEEAYSHYDNGEFAVQIMPFWQTSRFTSYMTDLKGKVAIAPVPQFSSSDPVKTIGGGGTGTAIIASSPNADLAAQVMAFIKLSPEANKEVWNVLGFDPVNTDVWSDKELTENPDNKFVQFFNTKPFDTLNEVKDGIGSLKSLQDEKAPSINNVFCTTTLTNIFENGADIKTELDAAQAELQNEFQ